MKIHAAIFLTGNALCGVKRTKENDQHLIDVFEFKPYLYQVTHICTKCQAMAKRILIIENVNID
jgi:hypothetical protein